MVVDMNILLLTRKTNPNGNSIYNSYTNGIVNNFPSSIVVDYFDLYFKLGKAGFEKQLYKIIKDNSINVAFINFVGGDMTFDIEFLQKLSKLSYMIMNFYDSELFFEPIDRYYAQLSDLVLMPSSKEMMYNYTLLNIKAINTFSLFDINLYQNIHLKKDIDISFVGDITKKSRKEFLDFLQSKGYSVKIFGKGSKNGHICFKKMIEIFNRSKININFSDTVEKRGFDKNSNCDFSAVPKILKYVTQLKGRSIEVALCGSFVLSQYAVGIYNMFDEDMIDTFKTKEELFEKVDYYLKNNGKREKMAQKAYIYAKNKFDVTKAFRDIFQNIKLNDRKEKKLFLDKVFLKNYATYHSLYLFNFLFRLKFVHMAEELKIVLKYPIRLNSAKAHLLQQFRYKIINRFLKWS